jgi:hypothetical protein
MIKVYQNVIDPKIGDCMQAVFASLFHKKLEEVPEFIKFGQGWFSAIMDFADDNGYKYAGMLHNVNFTRLCHPTSDCFEEPKYLKECMLNKENLGEGIDGFFYAGVLSPKFFNLCDGFMNQHAVICDKDLNVVHDPNPEYANLIKYPLADLLGCNGLIDVTLFKKK